MRMSRTIHWLVALLLAGCSLTSAYTIKPTNYTLDIFINTQSDVFSGTVEILADVTSGGATKIVLHNNGLNTSDILVSQKGSEKFQSVSFDTKMQTMEIHTSTGLETSSQVKITIAYEGKVSTDGTGLYMFLDSDGNKIYLTNFYPIYARKFFPCIDEPGSSATIALTVTVTSANGKFIASSSVTESKASNGYQVYTLDLITSVSPYSLFFTMGRWDNTYNLLAENVTLWLPQSLKGNTNLIDPNLNNAVSNINITNLRHFMAQNVLNILITPVLAAESYSGLNAVVLKKDIVINDLVETTTEDEKQHLVKISYALYKMIFGTLVQPANWGNNWLSNSISTYLAYHVLDTVNSYGSSDATLVTDFDERLLRRTWNENSPVPYLATSPTDPEAIMKFINGPGMDKGAYTIKTLETLFNKQNESSTVIEALLLFGLSNFGKSVDTQSFINTMSRSIKVNATGVTVEEILRPMIEQPGYPLISLRRAYLTLTLERTNFYYTTMIALPGGGSQTSKLSSAGSWLVPITSTTSNDPSTTQVSIYFYSPNVTTPLAINGAYDKNAWALLNIDGKGMLRVAYDDLTWAIFAQKRPGFTPATRAKLVTDAFAAAESGVQSWATTLSFLEFLDQETDLAPWDAALQGFGRMWTWIYPTGLQAKDPKQEDLSTPFKAYMSKRLENLYKNLGTSGKNGDPQDPLRRLIVRASCDYGSSACVTDLAAQYQSMVSGSSSPTKDMYSVVACNGLKGVQKVDDWRTAYQQYVNSGKWFSQRLIDSHYSILACSELPDAITEFMKKILINGTDTLVPFPIDQVKPAMEAIMDRPENVDNVLNFFISNQYQFNNYISTALQAELMKALGDRLTVPSQYGLLQGFAKNSSLAPALVTAVNEAITKAQQNINYIYSVQESVLAGLEGNAPPPTVPTTVTASIPTITGTVTIRPTGSTSPPTAKPGSAASLTVSMVTIALAVAILAFAQ